MVNEIKLDLERDQRIGVGEAVICAQKTVPQIAKILDLAADAAKPLLLTRMDARKAQELATSYGERLDYDPLSGTAFFMHPTRHTDNAQEVAIVGAGTSDAFVAREALRTLAFNGVDATMILDVGVAGLWRLTERLEEIRAHDIVIAVAGMDAAMVSVLGGLIKGPLIAVPTSTGYGAARDGETALASCLTSCAPGVTVCNIDNGYGAACAALRILSIKRN